MTMTKRLQPRILEIRDCGNKCSLNENNIGPQKADMVHSWYQAGDNDDQIVAKAMEAGFRLSRSAVSRHRRWHVFDPKEKAAESEMGGLSDVEALKAILERGQRFIPTWKITPSEYFKALDLYYRLTKGNAFDGLMSSLAAAANDIPEEEGEPKPDDPSSGDFDLEDG